jgi:DNA-binding transcriptional ArsR family regulator
MPTNGGHRDDTPQGSGPQAGEAAVDAAQHTAAARRDGRRRARRHERGDGEPGPSYRRLRDPRELQALAHPVRLGIMELLTVSGPLTATELADRLDETPANCSWHLRKLAEHDFVEEAGGGIGRQRPWRVRTVGLAWDEGDATPSELRAGRALEELLMERQVARLHASRAQLHDDGDETWADVASVSQSASWLTAEELDDVNAELRGVLERYADRLVDPTKRPPGARLCELVAWGVPLLLPGVEAVPEAVPESAPEGEAAGAVAGADAS